MVFDVMRMISTQIRWQDPLLVALLVVRTSFGFHLRNVWGVPSPRPECTVPMGLFTASYCSSTVRASQKRKAKKPKQPQMTQSACY